MRRWVVMVMAAGALVVILLGWRSFHRVMSQKTCALNGGHWNAAAHRCETQPWP
jgi:pheromone shutdown protein TraB